MWQPKDSQELSPLTVDWLSMLQVNSALFHATLYYTAAHMDLSNSSTKFTQTMEIKLHKQEAIRLINAELPKGKDIPEAIILAVLCLIQEPTEPVNNDNETEVSEEDDYSPFKLPLIPIQW